MAVEVKVGKAKKSTEPEFEPYYVNGYYISEPLTSNNSGFSKWGFCTKYGKTFFIKEFLSPKFPEADAEISETRRKNQVRECNEWFSERSKVYDIIMHSTGGNIVEPLDFFLFQNHFYLVTDRVEMNSVEFEQLHRVSFEQKHILLKVLANEFSKLAAGEIVHSDIKPSNLILKSTIDGYFTVKIIDFDDSFREEAVPYWDELHGDLAYFSPEAILYMDTEGEEGIITTKADVFSMGILFHQILCGTYPDVRCDVEYTYIGEGVLNGGEVIVSNQLSEAYQSLIRQMLCEDAEERLSMREVFERLCEIDRQSKLNGYDDDVSRNTDKSHDGANSGDSPWIKGAELDFD